MAGNVLEWVSDWYGEAYYSTRELTNPAGPASGELRVTRGGSWASNLKELRATFRAARGPRTRWNDVGIRCGANAEPEQLLAVGQPTETPIPLPGRSQWTER